VPEALDLCGQLDRNPASFVRERTDSIRALGKRGSATSSPSAATRRGQRPPAGRCLAAAASSHLSALWAPITERTEGMTKIDVFALPVLPAADVFPMMSDDELQELAYDIRENGIREPLVVAEVDGELVLVDGRNRRAACELAKLEPEVRHVNGDDPNAYVLSANIHRRNLTPGQRAMAVAMIRPEAEPASERGQKGGRGRKAPTSGEVSGVTSQRLADARAVLRYSRELAEAVVRGDKPLKAALADARQGQGSVLNARSRLAKLRDERPDLAELVTSELMSLDEAVEKARAEAEEHKQHRWAVTMNIIDSIRPLDRPPETAAEEISLYDPGLAESRGEKVSPTRLRRASDYLAALADAMEDLQ
jgi:hypothetical protein